MSVLVDLGASFYSPIYLVDGMPVTFSDELGAEENWTDLVYECALNLIMALHYESTKDGANTTLLLGRLILEVDGSIMTALIVH